MQYAYRWIAPLGHLLLAAGLVARLLGAGDGVVVALIVLGMAALVVSFTKPPGHGEPPPRV